MDDAEEEFNLQEVELGESGDNPSPPSDGRPAVAEATKASSTFTLNETNVSLIGGSPAEGVHGHFWGL